MYEDDNEHKIRIRKTQYAVVTILLASLVVFAIIAVAAILKEGPGKFVSTLESINPFYYGAALLMIFASDLIGFPKWHLFVKKLRIKVPWKKNLMIYLSMFSMDITPGRWGRAAAAYSLNQLTGIKFGKTFPAVVADIFTDFLGFVIIALVTSFMVKRFAMISIVIGVLLLLPFFFIYNKTAYSFFKKRLFRFRRLRGIFNVGDTYFTSHKLLDLHAYMYAMVFTIPAMVLNGIALYFVILSFGIHLSIGLLPTVLFIYTSSLLLGMVSGIPGTLGITDAALIGYLIAFFPSFGVMLGVASAITIFFRIGSMWFVEAVSTLFLIYTMRYWKT